MADSRSDSTIIQILRQVADYKRADEIAALQSALPGKFTLSSSNPHHLNSTLFEGIELGWERHSEASIATLFIARGTGSALECDADAEVVEALSIINKLPGKIVRATRMAIAIVDASADALMPQLGFSSSDLVSCRIGGWRADLVRLPYKR